MRSAYRFQTSRRYGIDVSMPPMIRRRFRCVMAHHGTERVVYRWKSAWFKVAAMPRSFSSFAIHRFELFPQKVSNFKYIDVAFCRSSDVTPSRRLPPSTMIAMRFSLQAQCRKLIISSWYALLPAQAFPLPSLTMISLSWENKPSIISQFLFASRALSHFSFSFGCSEMRWWAC